MASVATRVAALAFVAAASACDAPAPPSGTGGGVYPDGPCGRGYVVVESDYQSTNVALVAPDGAALSGSFISSAAATPGLVAPLSGDVALPSARLEGEEVVLVDRFPAAVLTWIELATAGVRAQLDVSTGFPSNPQDYLPLSPTRALVARYDPNPQPGHTPFDVGSDLLVVDPSAPAITGRVDLSAALETPGFAPRPARLARAAGGRVFALLAAYAPDFKSALVSRLVELDPATLSIVAVTPLGALHGCGGLAVRADGAELAVACSGDFGGDSQPTASESGLARVALDGAPTVVLTRTAADLGGAPLGASIAYAPDGGLLVTTLGALASATGPEIPDALLAVAPSGEVRTLRASAPFALGDVRCAAACGTCLVADAGASVLVRLRATAGVLAPEAELVVETAIGLPPRLLGPF